MIDGSEKLFYFDLLAHKWLVSEKYFKSQVLFDTARTLAEKLCNILDPLISSNNPPISPRSLSSPAPHHLFTEIEQHFHTRSLPQYSASDLFHESFVSALKLKFDLTLANTMYKLVFPKPGDMFNTATMALDPDLPDCFSHVRKDRTTNGSKREEPENRIQIKMCLFPALYSGPTIKQSLDCKPEFGMEQCLVEHNNFTREGSTDGGSQELSLVAKAVVLL